ncbi:MAG: Cbb3-type cytochrome c oxidase subunit CcoP [Steroidobacteraceae bacterium]|nr:Cbb3-type cytochrome c oxidase subunit CcoP [Steroidobacteraceae bacterium]
MNSFWSMWVMFLVLLNAGITAFLFWWAPRVRIPVQEDGTTGHVWAHGVLREGMHRLPRWWIIASAAMYLFGIGYLLLYPGFGAHKGLLGWSAHGEHDLATAVNDANLAETMARFKGLPPAQLAADPEALRIGERLFVDNCAACHERSARGNPLLGAPNLVDADWTWGGDDASIATSILDGRQGVMPPLGEAIGAAKVADVANYVLSLSGAPHDAAKAAAGAPEFAVCAACHGQQGEGNPLLGAPKLADSIWTWGGGLEAIEKRINEGTHGVMPAWKSRLDENDVRVIIAWLRSQAPNHLARL